MIPKVIHYCWFGGKPLPWDVEKCIKSWKKQCPDYKIVQWDESNLDVNSHPFMKAAYEAKAWAFVSDYARLWVIYNHGGVYLDTDVELLKNLDAHLEHSAYFGIQQSDRRVNTGLGFGAEAGHSAIGAMMEQYDRTAFDNDRRVEIACPVLNTAALEGFGYCYSEDVQYLHSGVVVYPTRFFDPQAPGDTQNLTCKDSVSIHHYSNTWLSGKSRLKRQLIRLIGQERVIRLRNFLRKQKKKG